VKVIAQGEYNEDTCYWLADKFLHSLELTFPSDKRHPPFPELSAQRKLCPFHSDARHIDTIAQRGISEINSPQKGERGPTTGSNSGAWNKAVNKRYFWKGQSQCFKSQQPSGLFLKRGWTTFLVGHLNSGHRTHLIHNCQSQPGDRRWPYGKFQTPLRQCHTLTHPGSSAEKLMA